MRPPTIINLIPAPLWAQTLEAQWTRDLKIRILAVALCRTDAGQEAMWLDEDGNLRPLGDLR